MRINVLEKGNEQAFVETLGGVIRHTNFIHMFMITLTSTTLLLVLSIGNYWPSICHEPDAALFGLIGGLYTSSITGIALIVSTILVDDCSWFFKFFTLVCSSFLFIGCGIYHLHGFYHKVTCQFAENSNYYLSGTRRGNSSEYLTNRMQAFPLMNKTPNEDLNTCFKEDSLLKYATHTPLLIFACIFAGVVYFLFALYLSLTLDME